VQVVLKALKVMPILNQGRFAQTPFPAEKIKEARHSVRERIRQRRLARLRENQPKQLLDRIADTPRRSFALGLGVLPAVARQPILDERLNVGREFLPLACSGPLSKLSESEQDRYTYKNIPCDVALLAKPYNVTFDGVANPACADSIDRSRADEITVQHDNLLSLGEVQKMIARSTQLLCAQLGNGILGKAVVLGGSAT
jgi:hypothetical protein